MPLQRYLTSLLFKRLFLLFCLVSCTAVTTGQVLTEKITDLGFGFKQIQHTQVNVAGRWKSDVKFHFLYYEKRRLCQCTLYAISASGRYAIFQETATKESFIFHVNTQEREQISKAPLRILKEVTWNKNESRAQLAFQDKNQDKDNDNSINAMTKLTLKIKPKRLPKAQIKTK